MTIATASPFEGTPSLGWALIGVDETIAAADAKFARRLGAAQAAEVVGRRWHDFVEPEDHTTLAEIEAAVGAGQTWRGRFAVRTSEGTVDLDVDASPRGDAALALRIVGATLRPPATPPVDGGLTATASVDSPTSLEAVLEQIRRNFGVDVVLVVRTREDGRAIEVLGVHPAGIAGAETGVWWSPPDASERAVIESGEPAVDGTLAVHRGDSSPLARLPGYGLRSAVRVPLFVAGEVAGLVVAYSTRPAAFSHDEALRLERTVRGLALISTPPMPASTKHASTAEPFDKLVKLLGGVAHELMTTIAHELNNPLTAVAGYAQTLRSLPAAEQARALEVIEREALRAGAVVHRLLNLTQDLARPDQPARPPAENAETPSISSAAKETASAPPSDSGPPRGAGQRVLIVDDEEAIRALASRVLTSFGYAPSAAASATEALTLLEQRPYDAILSDIRMPGMDGVALYREVARRWPRLADRVVIMTGDVENEAVATLLRERGLASLEKPFRLEALLAALAAALDGAPHAS
ncbi:MAG: response regulator [Dehalococcoidia bacterium]|nr:response regulator [Dehalococcoidia bacterium]